MHIDTYVYRYMYVCNKYYTHTYSYIRIRYTIVYTYLDSDVMCMDMDAAQLQIPIRVTMLPRASATSGSPAACRQVGAKGRAEALQLEPFREVEDEGEVDARQLEGSSNLG